MVKPRVLVTETIHQAGLDRLAQEAEVVNLPSWPGQTVAQHLPEVDGVIVRLTRIGPAELDSSPRLKVVGKHGVGVDNIDLEAAAARKVTVVFTPGTNDEAVAEHTLMMMLMLARKVIPQQNLLLDGKFDDARRLLRATDLIGKTLGLVGLGRVGAQLTRMCRTSFGMRVLARDPYITADRAAELGVELTDDLELLLRVSDFVSVHTPLTPETRGMIGSAELAQMKPTAYLLNNARGGIVEEQALADALRQGVIAGAGLDAFVDEPPKADNPLLTLGDKVILTPHLAGGSEEAMRNMAVLVAEEVLRVIKGEAPHHPVRQA